MSLGAPPTGYAEALGAYKVGDLRRAALAIERLLRASPDDLRVRSLSAMVGARSGQLDQSEQTLLGVIADCPDEHTAFGVRHQLALVHLQQRRLGDALTQIDLALAASPDSPVLLSAKADMLLTANRRDEADALLTGELDQFPDDSPPNLALATAFARLRARAAAPERDRAIALLERAIPAKALPTMEVRRAIHQLGALYEDAERFDEAFACFARAGNMAPTRYDRAPIESLVAHLVREWTPGAVKRAVGEGASASEAPVFIVGMPRSGTSLAEQILASHPSVEAVGESDALSEAACLLGADNTLMRARLSPPAALTPESIAQAAASYTNAVLTPNAPALRVTDKHPMNFLRLGLLPLLFPGARVVHCVRDPRDTCLSCFAQHFVGDHPYANQLADLGHFYRQYLRLMAHWRSVLEEAGVPMLDLVYERVVADPEAESRALIGFAGLDWHDACLRPHESERITWTHSNEQVRRPVYATSAGRWRRFERHLTPLISALGDAPPDESQAEQRPPR